MNNEVIIITFSDWMAARQAANDLVRHDYRRENIGLAFDHSTGEALIVLNICPEDALAALKILRYHGPDRVERPDTSGRSAVNPQVTAASIQAIVTALQAK